MLEKIIISIVIGLVFSLGFTINANAASLYVDTHVGDMAPIENSKYKASALTVNRNSQGELISVVRTDATRYLPEPIIDTYLNSDPNFLIKQGVVNKEKVNMYQVKVTDEKPKCLTKIIDIPGQTDRCNWYYRAFVTMLAVSNEKVEEPWFLFKGLNHMFSVKGLDEVTSTWTIFSRG